MDTRRQDLRQLSPLRSASVLQAESFADLPEEAALAGPLQPDFTELLAFLTQLLIAAHPILPSHTEKVFPSAVPPWTSRYPKRSRRWNRTMSLKRPIAWIAALVAVVSLGSVARAQVTVLKDSHV